MANKNLFGLTNTKTTLDDTDNIVGGTGLTGAFNITWANFRTFLKTLFISKTGNEDIGGIKNFTTAPTINSKNIVLADGTNGNTFVTKAGVETITGEKTFNNNNYAPIVIKRTGVSENVQIKFEHNGGFGYLGFDASNRLKWGESIDANINNTIYHSGNSNKSDVDWSANNLQANFIQIGDGVDTGAKELLLQRGTSVDSNSDYKIVNSGGVFSVQGRAGGSFSNLISGAIGSAFNLHYAGIKKLETTAAGTTVTGTVTADGYIPFTGCHLAEFQDQDFKDFQLVKIKQKGHEFSSNKQPIWEASYVNPNEKGIFGVVYGLNIEPIMEEYEEEELQEVKLFRTEVEESYEIKEIDGDFIYTRVENEVENPVMIEVPVLNPDKTPVMQITYEEQKIMDGDQVVEVKQIPKEVPLIHTVQATEEKIITVKKTRQIGEKKHWMIAAIGDMPVFVCSENGNIEYGDKLTASSRQGVAMKANEDSPICAIAGADVEFTENEIVKIGVTKE